MIISDKVHKQGFCCGICSLQESTFHNIATFHTCNPPYIINSEYSYSANQPVCYCYLRRDGCVKCSNVVECGLLQRAHHSTTYKSQTGLSLCIYTCQPVPPPMQPFLLHLVDIYNFLKFSCFYSFFLKSTVQTLCFMLWLLVHHPRMCTDEWRPTASTLYLLGLPCKVAHSCKKFK